MSEARPKNGPRRDPDSWDFEEARRAAALEGLRLTPEERLRWLEETMAELEGFVGLAAEREGDGV